LEYESKNVELLDRNNINVPVLSAVKKRHETITLFMPVVSDRSLLSHGLNMPAWRDAYRRISASE